MAKRFAAFAVAWLVGLTVAGNVAAERPDELSDPLYYSPYLTDTPRAGSPSYARGGGDTTAWGGVDANGQAVEDGVWDFEGGPLGVTQGWTTLDLTDVEAELGGATPARHVKVDDEIWQPQDTNGTITAGGSTGSVWFGAVTAETLAGCWPGGQGYSNNWGLNASRLYTWGLSGDVTISMDYFVDSELQFDFSYVYVINSDGQKTDPVNTSLGGGRPEDGLGWSGATSLATAIGSPGSPANEVMTVDSSVFSGAINGPAFEVLVNFDSDPLLSDGLDSQTAFLNSVNGPLGFDNVLLTGIQLNELSDFEKGDDGWAFFIDPKVGGHMKVGNLLSLDVISYPCECPLAANVLLAADLTGPFPHPKKQYEQMVSPPAYTALNPAETRIVRYQIFSDLPRSNGVGYRPSSHYYPWTCPNTLVTGWTIEPADLIGGTGGGFYFTTIAICGTAGEDVTGALPAAVDSIKVAIELIGDCDNFGTQNCTGPAQTNQSPYWDNIQLLSVAVAGQNRGATSPVLSAGIIYQDVFPAANTLLPIATANVHSQHDNNRADRDLTNANMGDSATAVGGTEPTSQVFLNFRVYPGPSTDTKHAWFSKYGGNFIAPNWAKARMDTAELAAGIDASIVVPGLYSTYDWPNGQEDMLSVFPASSNQKIIPDDVLTAGSSVEYFFSANFTPTPFVERLDPDTTGGTYFEFEVLPGYFEVNAADEGTDILAPCFLYVDAFNAGAQEPIEDRALSDLLGFVTDVGGVVHPNWDRYDYLSAFGNTPGPLAREVNGDNGMTGYQSMIYKTILYNTGSFPTEGLRDGDAALLANFLVSDDFNRPSIAKGLWLSGNGMARMLGNPLRSRANLLLAGFCQAVLDCSIYWQEGCSQSPEGDLSLCVRIDGTVGADFSQSEPYAARGNGCPDPKDPDPGPLGLYTLQFDVLTLAGSTANLQYVDQDAGGTVTQYASVTNDQFASPANYGVVLDGFSAHYLRKVPTNWEMTDCGQDSTGVRDRAADVFGFLQVAGSGCDPDPLFTAVGDPSVNGIADTRLFQNSPNPFNPTTTVRYQLHDQTFVKLMIYDVSGKLVRTLVEDVQVAGKYSIAWDGSSDTGREVSSGVYWARMSTSLGFQASTKMVVLK